MDPKRMQEVLDALQEWNLVEVADKGFTFTRRWRGALMRAASELRDEEARRGPVAGHPVRLQVERAFNDLALVPAGELSEDYVTFLTAMAVEEMPREMRDMLGV
ncbi:MAG: hypothetical protein ACYDCK_10825 [Thermoplasmatota archaeon]